MKQLSFIVIVAMIVGACTNNMKQSEVYELNSRVETSGDDSENKEVVVFTEKEKEFHHKLYWFISECEFDSVKYLLENNDVDFSKYDSGEDVIPLIYWAAASGNKDIFDYLIEKGANPDVVISGPETILNFAAYGGNLDIVKYLIKRGAKIYHPAYGDASPLHAAAEGGKYEVFIYLAKKQSFFYDWQGVLYSGISGGNLDIVKYLVEKKGAKVNRKFKKIEYYPVEFAANNKYTFSRLSNSNPVEIVKYLIGKGADPSKINGGKVISWAMYQSDDATVEYLLNIGMPVDVENGKRGWTPLAMALDENCFSLAKHYIQKRKNHTFREKPLVLYFADGEGDSYKIIDFLIKEGVNKEYYAQALRSCVALDDSASTHLLLRAGVDVHYRRPNDLACMLHYVKSAPVASLLIENGVDIGDRIMLANAWKNPPLLYALKEVGVYPPMTKQNMNTTLGNAAKEGDVRTVKYMLERDANVNARLPLGKITEREQQLLLDEIELKADDERYDSQIDALQANIPVAGQTPLIKNAIQGYVNCLDWQNGLYENGRKQVCFETTEILLKAGANPNIADSRGKTALHYAVGDQSCRSARYPDDSGFSRYEREMGAHGEPIPPSPYDIPYHDFIAKLLVEYGADINVKDKKGDTPLILAAKSGNSLMLKILLEAKADFSVKNKRGKTMFDYLDDEESIRMVKEAGLQYSR